MNNIKDFISLMRFRISAGIIKEDNAQDNTEDNMQDNAEDSV